MLDSALTYLIGKAGEELPFLAVIWAQMQARTCFLLCKNGTLVHAPLASCREDLCCSAKPLCWRWRSRSGSGGFAAVYGSRSHNPCQGQRLWWCLGSSCFSLSWERESLLTHTLGRAGQQCSTVTLVSPMKKRKISSLHSERWKHKCVESHQCNTGVRSSEWLLSGRALIKGGER